MFLLALAACVRTNMRKLFGSRTDVVFGKGINAGSPSARDTMGGGGLRRCIMRGCNRRSMISSVALTVDAVGLVECKGSVSLLRYDVLRDEDELGDGGREVIGVGRPEGRGVDGGFGSRISSLSGTFAAAVSYEMVMRSNWRNKMRRSRENSCSLEGVYDIPTKSRMTALPSDAPWTRCM